MEGSYDVGDRVFFNHKEEGWLLGTVKAALGNAYTCTSEDGGVTAERLAAADLHKVVDSSLKAVHDLLNMTYLHDSTLLHHIRTRYWRSIMYTNIGPILLALNPYDYTLPSYTDDNMPKYIDEGSRVLTHGSNQLPHPWSIAHQAYYLMKTKNQNQSVIVSGESGSGKTEAAKIVLKYLGELSTNVATTKQKQLTQRINLKVHSTSPILETFGNAKTTRNDNSSRFGKYMRVQFDSSGLLVGAHITPYLLERSRVITHAPGERGYHAFYQLVAGAPPEEKARMRLRKVTDYRMLCAGSCPNIEGVDDAEEYAVTIEALNQLDITADEQRSLFNILAAILHLNNLTFREREGASYLPEVEKASLEFVAKELLCINSEALYRELTTTTRSVAGDTFTTSLDKVRATEQKDSLCKTLYEGAFLWLVERINNQIHTDACAMWIGLLDIFGFEHFERNSFEQLCINLTNEQLQQHYNHCIFTKDMEECKREGIDTQSIVFQDNQPTLNLMLGPLGVMSILDDEVQLAKGSDISFAAKLSEAQGSHPSYIKHRMDRSQFGIRHYAGNVMYGVDGWREKNMDTLKDQLKLLVRSGSDPFIAGIVPEPVEQVSRKPTVARIYKMQLTELMKVINSTTPHWIRCVKPHSAKQPRMFNGQEVMAQLRSAGVLETVRVRKLGYSVRLPFLDFLSRYKAILPSGGYTEERTGCLAVLKEVGIEKQLGQVGKTKVFLRNDAWFVLEETRTKALFASAVVVQRFLRHFEGKWRVAAKLGRKRVATVQSFARVKLSRTHVRRVEYQHRKDTLVDNARQLLMLVRDEERCRIALMRLEVDDLHYIGQTKRKDLEELVARWFAEKPMRDAIEHTEFKIVEKNERALLERHEQESLLRLLDDLKDDFDVMQRRQREREYLEEQERARLAEARLHEQRQRAQLLWARVEEERRLQEEEELAKDYEKYLKLAKVQEDLERARELYSTEKLQATREKRMFNPDAFCPTVGKSESPARFRSPTASHRGPPAPRPDGSYAHPTFSRLSMAGPSQVSHLYSSSTPPASTRFRRVPSSMPRSPSGSGKPIKATPAASHSLDMVKRLQKLSKAVHNHPDRLISSRFSPLDERSHDNPNNPHWHPRDDGTILLPDGSRGYIGELP